MDIRINSVYNAYNLENARHHSNTARAARARTDTDRVSLSAQAGDYQTARRAVANTPDIRADVVGRIQEMLESGTYRIPTSDVAARIFQGIG